MSDQEAEVELFGDRDGLQRHRARVERERHRVAVLGVQEECSGARSARHAGRSPLLAVPSLQAGLDLPDEGDGHALFKLIHRRVDVEDFDNLGEGGWGQGSVRRYRD